MLLFESVAFALLMREVVRQLRRDAFVSRRTLLHVIMRDNIVYFAVYVRRPSRCAVSLTRVC